MTIEELEAMKRVAEEKHALWKSISCEKEAIDEKWAAAGNESRKAFTDYRNAVCEKFEIGQ